MISATMPCSVTSRHTSEVLKRDSGTPRVRGNSQAKAFTATTTAGGEKRGATAPRSIPEPGEPLLKETLAPFAHHLARHVQPAGDLLVGQPLGSHQHNLGSNHFAIRRRALPGLRLEPPCLFW